MPARPTLRRELITPFALLFASALIVVSAGVALLLPRLESARQGALYLIVLLLADVAIFAWFGRYMLERRLVRPIAEMIGQVEKIAGGDYGTRVPEAETHELERLGSAVNDMAESLISHQQQLAANIRSLDETNRLLTEARDAMVRAEKMASVGRLGSGIAHEIGNPLGAVVGYLGILAKRLDGPNVELVESAEREARRIDRIVRGLLDYARPRESRHELLDVNRVVHESTELIATQGRFSGVALRLALEEDLPPVIGDPYQLQQVLVNLLVNATDALRDRGDAGITVRTRSRAVEPLPHLPARRRDDPPGIDYSHRRRLASPAGLVPGDPPSPNGRIVELAVSDNGPGIADSIASQVFEPFVTTKEPGEGTGLGLAVSARLVESMGGTIRAGNRSGGGAIFTIALPAADVGEPQPAAAGAADDES